MRSFNPESAVPCPCKGCAERAIDCHGHCPKYEVFCAELAKIREARQREANKEYWARRPNGGRR